MKQVLTIIKFELTRIIFRRSFILTLILTPIIPFGIMAVYSMLEGENRTAVPAPMLQILEGSEAEKPEGFVDVSGLILDLPDGIHDRLLRFSSEADAREALVQDRISALYLVPSDYMESGRITVIRQDFNPLDAVQQSDALRDAVRFNLLRENPRLYDRIANPVNLQIQYLTSIPARDPEDVSTYLIPYIIAFVFYIVIFGSSSMLLNSVTEEKQNRIIEVLMTSIRPIQMLAGKVVALGMAGLFQMAVWALIGSSLYGLLGRTFSFMAVLGTLPPNLVGWGLLYFLFGFAVYASLMAGLGALVSNLREASQATMFIMMPLLAPLMLISVLVSRPNSPLAIALSLFPFTAPVTMPMRLAIGGVPLWQTILSVLLLAGTSVLIVRSAAGIFRSQNLLSGQTFKLGLFFKAFIGKV
jgi:ABC-2 type transport system permease protein